MQRDQPHENEPLLRRTNLSLVGVQSDKQRQNNHNFTSDINKSPNLTTTTTSFATNVIKNSRVSMMDTNKINIRKIGVGLFIIASIFCLFEIYNLETNKPKPRHYVKRLKLVNIFNRHGDRAPSDSLPKGDRHVEKISFFWPDGLHNLTDTGRLREYRVGLETRRKYKDFLDFDANKVLAFSSPVYRCQESMHQILKGLFEINWTKDMGRHLLSRRLMINCTNSCLPRGPGSPDDWKQVKVDTVTVPSLTHGFLDNCAYRTKNPSPIDKDFLADYHIRSLRGVEVLRDTIKKKYDQNFDKSMFALLSTITSEMELIRTMDTYNYTDHYRDWVNVNVTTRGNDAITFYDILEQAVLLASRNRIDDTANYVQSGPIITSLIESQMVALGHNVTNDRMKLYQDKQLVLYTTHDTTLQILLATLGILRLEHSTSFENRFYKWARSDDEEAKFLTGLRMSSYGLSIRFELWELEMEQDGIRTKMPYVQAAIYNRDDGKFRQVEYKKIDLGEICRKLFSAKYPRSDVNRFYPAHLEIDQKHSCPFNLFQNVTSHLMIDDDKIKSLCGSS